MSGDVVVLADDLTGFLTGAVAALSRLPDDLPAWGLVGGVAVIVRLPGMHRATADVDSVTREAERTFEVLTAAGWDVRGTRAHLPGGVRLDVIDVSEGDPAHAQFLAHRYALDTAGPVAIKVLAGGRTVARAIVPVATAGAVVATKVTTVATRPGTAKRGSDAYDVLQLVEVLGAHVLARDLAAAPALLQRETVRLVRHHYGSDVDRTRKWILDTSGKLPAGRAGTDNSRLRAVLELAEALEAQTGKT